MTHVSGAIASIQAFTFIFMTVTRHIRSKAAFVLVYYGMYNRTTQGRPQAGADGHLLWPLENVRVGFTSIAIFAPGRRGQVGEVRRGRQSKGKGKKRTRGKGKGLRKRRGELTPFAKIPAAAHGATGWVI